MILKWRQLFSYRSHTELADLLATSWTYSALLVENALQQDVF